PAQNQVGASLAGRAGSFRTGDGYGKCRVVRLQFACSLQQEGGFQAFVPIGNDDVEAAAGDLFYRAEDFRTTDNLEFKLPERLTQGLCSMLIGGEQHGERPHTLRLMSHSGWDKLRSAGWQTSQGHVTSEQVTCP